MLTLIKNRPCFSTDLTLSHLTRKLARLERRTQRPNATQADYNNRDRVARQLIEARTYLC